MLLSTPVQKWIKQLYDIYYSDHLTLDTFILQQHRYKHLQGRGNGPVSVTQISVQHCAPMLHGIFKTNAQQTSFSVP